MKRIFARLVNLLPVTAVLLLMGANAAHAQLDTDNTNPTRWNWLRNISANDLLSYQFNNNTRITDIRVSVTNNIPSYNAVVVSNTGSYSKGNIWFAQAKPQDVINYANANNMRVNCVAPFVISNTLYVSAALIPRETGVNWSMVMNTDPAAVYSTISSAGQRLIQFKQYTFQNKKWYIGVGMTNDRGWWVFWGANAATIQAKVSQGFRVLSVSAFGTGTYLALLDTLTNRGSQYYLGINSDTVWGNCTFTQDRPISINGAGSGLFNLCTINN